MLAAKDDADRSVWRRDTVRGAKPGNWGQTNGGPEQSTPVAVVVPPCSRPWGIRVPPRKSAAAVALPFPLLPALGVSASLRENPRPPSPFHHRPNRTKHGPAAPIRGPGAHHAIP